MMQLVYTYCLSVRRRTLANTFYPLLTAVFLLFLSQFLNAQCYTLICNQNVQLGLNDQCQGTANPYYMIQNNWSCQGPMVMTYYDQWGTNIGNIVTETQLGQTLNVHVKHNWTGLTCWGTVYVTDKKKPVITTSNVTLNCTQEYDAASLPQPGVTDNCSEVISLSYTDTLLDFGCGYTGFAGYFAPSNWTLCPTSTGDGGVDVNGAPDAISVEGADNSPLNLNPRYVTRYKITIPTDGYVSFDWSAIGGSTFNTDAFYLTINNWCVQLSSDTIQSGSYTTGLLHAGDVLSFEQTSDGNTNVVNTLISNFHFATQAWKVIQRNWKAVDELGNIAYKLQTITVKRAALSQVVFPPNHDGIDAPMLPCGASANLNITGVPIVDEDGNLATTADQFGVSNGDCTFAMTYADQSIPTCEGSELILRKWTVIEDCTGAFVEHTQLIKIFDVTPPTMICPAPAAVSTNNAGCFSSLNLPPASATDDCASTVNIVPSWSFGSGYGPFSGIAPGTYPVVYTATDACGNSANCTTHLVIEDEIAPTVVCDGVTVAALGTNGTALVHAESVDDGSYDWCCVDSYLIKRKNQPDNTYTPSLLISCGDLTGNVMVTLKVTDCEGNYNICDVEVTVEDQLAPSIAVPAGMTLDCNTDLSNLAAFGTPVVTDNCTYTLSESVSENFSNCGEGSITRTWTATDPSGNVSSAQQVIVLDNLQPWNQNGSQIVWSPDYVTSGCDLNLDPYELPAPYNGPIFVGQNGCESVGVAYTDEIFWISEPSCYKVFRSWQVIDWCQYTANSGNNQGMWEHLQVIEVNDTEAPVFTGTADDFFIALSGNGCTGSLTLPAPAVSDCSDHVTITATGQLGSGFSFQNVQSGDYNMTFTATDGCGNMAQQTFTVHIGDSQAPTAYCLNGLNITLDNDGEITLPASVFNSGSSDNCTPAGQLIYCYSTDPSDQLRSYTCDEVGQHPITMYVIDGGGNASSCQTSLVVMNNTVACALTPPGVDISGLVQTPFGTPVGQVTMNLNGSSSLPETTQPGFGTFSFNDLPTGNDYTLTPGKNIFPQNGVSSFDLVKINNHILNIEPFTQAWQVIAADANGNGTVTAADLVAVQSIVLFTTTSFPNGVPSWRFVPQNHVFTNPLQPFPFPETMSFNDLTSDFSNANFIGIKIGDVTGNAIPSMLGLPGGSWQSAVGSEPLAVGSETGERSGDDFVLKTEDRSLQAGEVFELTISSEEAAAAWQLTFEFDSEKMEFQALVPQNGVGKQPVFGTSFLAEGKLTALFFSKNAPSQAHFTLRFSAKQNALLSEVISVASSLTPAAAWNFKGEKMEVKLDFGSLIQPSSILNSPSSMLTNHPNPFSESTTLRFGMQEAGAAKFTFHDASGRLLHAFENSFEKGRNKWVVRREDLGTTGLVICRMETAAGVSVCRMMVQ